MRSLEARACALDHSRDPFHNMPSAWRRCKIVFEQYIKDSSTEDVSAGDEGVPAGLVLGEEAAEGAADVGRVDEERVVAPDAAELKV